MKKGCLSIREKSAYPRHAITPAVTPVVADREVQTLCQVERGDIVVIRHNFAITMEKDDSGGGSVVGKQAAANIHAVCNGCINIDRIGWWLGFSTFSRVKDHLQNILMIHDMLLLGIFMMGLGGRLLTTCGSSQKQGRQCPQQDD